MNKLKLEENVIRNIANPRRSVNIENDDKWVPVKIIVVTDAKVAMGIVVKNKTCNIHRINPLKRIIAISFL